MILAFEATERGARSAAGGRPRRRDHARADGRRQATNPRYHRLLKAFERRTGVPVLLNTSFNIKGEADRLHAARRAAHLLSTGLDALVIGPYLLTKSAA